MPLEPTALEPAVFVTCCMVIRMDGIMVLEFGEQRPGQDIPIARTRVVISQEYAVQLAEGIRTALEAKLPGGASRWAM